MKNIQKQNKNYYKWRKKKLNFGILEKSESENCSLNKINYSKLFDTDISYIKVSLCQCCSQYICLMYMSVYSYTHMHSYINVYVQPYIYIQTQIYCGDQTHEVDKVTS